METATVYTKYQVVIPKKVREQSGIQPGHKVQAIPTMGRIELIPQESIKENQGFLKGMDTDVERGPDRE